MIRPPQRLTPGLAWLLSLLLLGIVGYLDIITGFEFSVSVFYLLPVTLLSWYAGRRSGVTGAFLAAAVWLLADTLSGATYRSAIAPYWNASVRLGFFLFAGLTSSALLAALRREQGLARTDPLTGAANRRQFLEAAEMELRRAARYGRPFSVAYLDLDRFKEMNDRHGHEAGDRLLCDVALALKAAVRSTDLVARMGGDEFAILMPETGAEVAEAVADKLRKAVALLGVAGEEGITLSMGLATWVVPAVSVDELLSRADALMYEAKQAGGNGFRREVFGGA